MEDRTTERNDGGPYRTTITLGWAAAWIGAIDDRDERDAILAYLDTGAPVPPQYDEDFFRIIEDEVAAIDCAERRYWACPPGARAHADRAMDGYGCDWDGEPQYRALLAERAEWAAQQRLEGVPNGAHG